MHSAIAACKHVARQVRGADSEIISVQVPTDYDGGPVMVWNDGHTTKVFIGSDAMRDDFEDAVRVHFTLPAGVDQVQPQLAPFPLADQGRAGVRAAHANPSHLSLSCHALALAAAQGLQKGDFDSFNSDAVANANAVTPVGAHLLKTQLGPDCKLIPRKPHSSSSLLTERDEEYRLNAPNAPSQGTPPLTARALAPSLQHTPWRGHTHADTAKQALLMQVTVRSSSHSVEYHL